MRLPTSIAWAAALVVAPVIVAVAQEPVTVQPGSRIRLTVAGSSEPVVGTFLRREGDSLEVRPEKAGTRTIALEQLQRLEVSAGKRHPIGTSLLIGTGIGAGVGAVTGFAIGPCDKSTEDVIGTAIECGMLLQGDTRGETAAVWAVLGAMSGAVTGLVVGAAGHEKWVSGSLPGWRPIVAASARGMRLGFSIALGHSRADRVRRMPAAP